MSRGVQRLRDPVTIAPIRPVVRGILTPAELASREAAVGRRPVPDRPVRSVRSNQVIDGYAEFFARYPLDVMFGLTFSDEYARAHKIYTPTSALNNLERWFKEIGYTGQWFAAPEPHFFRDVPHLHGLMESRGVPLDLFWGEWFKERGRARFEPPRSDAAIVYCAKYALKDYKGDAFRFNLRFRTRAERRSDAQGDA
jgi:hypothetical protein